MNNFARPYVEVKIERQKFERVRLESASGMKQQVAAAMAAKTLGTMRSYGRRMPLLSALLQNRSRLSERALCLEGRSEYNFVTLELRYAPAPSRAAERSMTRLV